MAEAAIVDPKTSYLAQKKLRLANFVFDWFFALIFTFLAAVFLSFIGFGAWLDNIGKFEERLVGIALYVLYYLTFEAAFGWTFAKLITKTRVVDASGAKPKFIKVLGRSLARIVPFEPFSFLGENPVGWHDKWSGTRVVSLRHSQGHTLAESFAVDIGEEPQDQKPEALAVEKSSAHLHVPALSEDSSSVRQLPEDLSSVSPALLGVCPNCGKTVRLAAEECPYCKALFIEGSTWKVEPLRHG